MDLNVRVDVNFVRVDVICEKVILISLNTKVPLMSHAKFQPNILSHSGENLDFIGFAIF